MNYYPFNSAIILTDSIFFDYGGHRGSSSPEQRQAAYWIAERTATEDINTFLLPTIVTGSFLYNPLRDVILEHGYINQIIETKFIDKEENTYFTIAGIGNEAPGDVGVQDYRNQQYSESRAALIRTVFGTSARAQFVYKLFTKLRKHRWVGL